MKQQIISFQKKNGLTSRKIAEILGYTYGTYRVYLCKNKLTKNDLQTLKNFKK